VKKELKKSKKILLTRFGGIGDVAPVMVVGKQLKKRGHHVTIALRKDGALRQTDLLTNTDCYDKKVDLEQVGPWGDRCIEYPHGLKTVKSFYRDYDLVVDFMFVVEGNNLCKSTIPKLPIDEWQKSRNSNWINWYDLHLAWANIDPTSVPDGEKRAIFKLGRGEKRQAESLKSKFGKIFVINPVASSLARTWYQAQELLPKLSTKYPDCLIALWNAQRNNWDCFTKNGPYDLGLKVESPLRKSMTLVSVADVYVGADTGFSHIAEGLGVKHIAIYSTVPSWTRAKYYKHQTPIDMGEKNGEFYTFALLAGDPLNITEGFKNLTKREQLIGGMQQGGVSRETACKKLNTDSLGLDVEFESLQRKIQGFDRIQSKSLSGVSADMVFKKMGELC